MITLTEFLIFSGCLLLLVIIFRLQNGKRKRELPYPPSFPSLPLVGSLPFIKDIDELADYFMKKSYELGPIFSLRFGSRFVVVLNNKASIENALVKHASSFSGREGLYTEKYHANIQQKGIVNMNYHEKFKRYKRLSLSVLKDLGLGSKNVMEERILLEVNALIDHLKTTNGTPFDPKEKIVLSVSNVTLSILFSKREKYEDGYSEVCSVMKNFVQALEPALDVFPILRYIPPYSRKFEDVICSIRKLLELMKKETRESLKYSNDADFVHRYVEKEGIDYDHEQLHFTVRDLYSAGAETTSTTLLWTLVLLANHPQVMERLQKEIDSVVSRDRLPTLGDEPKMPYVQATILEIMRHRVVVPLAIPHITLHDTDVLGFFIPMNTVVLPNIQAANTNRNDWPESESFIPERFLDKDNRMTKKDDVISFSLGRRSCLGESLARQELFLFISGIVQNFSIQPPDGIPKINDKGILGITLSPLPFQIRLIARST